jgi:prevent-host-death family protein
MEATMARMNATDAKNRFGQLLEMARTEPVHVQKNGRDVGIMMSPEQYEKFLELSSAPKVRPVVDELLARSIERRRSLYQALAK